ncbi:30S ribosomal protein S1 [Clostridium sp. MF28]|uniref:30S ribosomal protein S1 n=1 Tax=Clostridium TaxID=1485 RepID=UPI0003D2B75A|nr:MULTISPECIES: 30S ribosomal protein S1 [Clostridium]ALB48166.1 30S ribosomal protein S1 [Clostridium beijerinckii NRRL B-598]AVK49586.1 30S ribosomal protein S1 [Clostridium sp. MF28]PSM58125.1 30S ribosomal protein S1 [Clostridium diolis]
MSNEELESNMSELLNQYDVKRLNRGDVLKGKVIDVNDKEVSVNIDYAFDGLIAKEEVSIDDRDPMEVVSKDDEIYVYVISPNDGEGYVELSLIKALEIKDREELSECFKEEKNVKVHVKEETKGGVIAYYGNIKVFIPGSLASRERIQLSNLVGRDLDVRITELDFNNKRVIASRRILEEEEYNKNKKNIWDDLKEGEKRNGVVKKIVKFGAFVDIGGVEGLIHISDLSWERVNRPEDIVKEGDKVEVFIGSVDRKNERLSLILKDVTKEPWTVHSNDINEGDILEGKVVRLTAFGAFVELFDGIEGLVHITEITDEHIAKPSDVLEVNQKVKVKVLSINREEKRIALSIKEAVENNKEYLDYIDNSDESGTSLGDLLKGFKFE